MNKVKSMMCLIKNIKRKLSLQHDKKIKIYRINLNKTFNL